MSASQPVAGHGSAIFRRPGNVLWSLFRRLRASRILNNNRLEWTTGNPVPGHGNFDTGPVVYHGPYVYGELSETKDNCQQTEKGDGLAITGVH